jgi:hypothetical protein
MTPVMCCRCTIYTLYLIDVVIALGLSLMMYLIGVHLANY